ncbi:mannose-6-phosphate isomerase, type 1 [Cryobacterium psychrotolerans]|uniref:mannose-6-phosphate isomerase n=1 Tax=Cryobacterium psychrotolerans TaxID=386301 RepID=A0A1G9CIH0_9MICO|nr:mannose-6-phosphate isomerase, class I [Cryobacterium psychrotolerans]TFD84280.1 mannose-6-phosphate isomerase, class I [Cryobacterium psychrotolerans]SDK51205.1 mannose-6-phosphate isomerase, type 1 [Cryobacterium psychrotolerans]
MFVGISNTPRDYAWGSPTAIATLLGRERSGKPEAELWLGAHAGSPSTIVDPGVAGGATNLAEWIAASPERALGARLAGSSAPPRLPFLMKILAAGSPLSLQAHPSPEQARAGFALENEAGIPVDAAGRNYRDPFHKPELIYALSETFDALCGFRDLGEIRRILAELRALDAASDEPQAGALDAFESRLLGPDALHDVVDWLLRDGRGGDTGEVAWLVERVVALARQAAYLAEGGAVIGFAAELATVRDLAEAYPGDPGIVLSLLLNHVTLRRGEVLYLPAGNIHAYLSGLGVEVMAASDNVLRGGLTPKHIDIDELLDVLDFTPLPVPYLPPSADGPGVSVYRPDVPDFRLVRVDADAAGPGDVPMRQVTLAGPAIAICTAGGFLVAGAASSARVKRGDAVFVTPDEGTITFAGAGEVFLATTNTP